MKSTHLISIFIFFFITLYPSWASTQTNIKRINYQQQVIISASKVRIRQSPNTTSKILAHLALGDVITTTHRTVTQQSVNGQKAYWYQIKKQTSDPRRPLVGWVAGNLLLPYKASQREAIYLKIIQQRIDKHQYSFTDMRDSYVFIERALSQIDNPTIRAELKLGQLLALQKSINIITPGNATHKQYAAWLKRHQKKIFYDEIQGRWLVKSEYYWDLASTYINTRASDNLSWHAANAPIGGECEGDISCNLARELITTAAYLQRHPGGDYVDFALAQLNQVLNLAEKQIRNDPQSFSKTTYDQQTLRQLHRTVQRTQQNARGRGMALQALQRLQALPQ